MRLPSAIIPQRERITSLAVGRGRLDVQDGALVFSDEQGTFVQIPVGGIACLMLEPGTTITHAAVALAAACGTLLLWIGEGGVRFYSAGQPGGARADKLLYQAKLALDDAARLKVVRAMYRYRFKEEPPQKRSIEQLRGIEGARVKFLYQQLARESGLKWQGRSYDPKEWAVADPLNQALSAATHSLYGITEAAILAAGYAPAIGFIHTGKPRSFVYDIADLIKFETVVPMAFKAVAQGVSDPVREVRLHCRNSFRKHKTLNLLIPLIEEILAAGELEKPSPHQEAVPIAFPEPQILGDQGLRRS